MTRRPAATRSSRTDTIVGAMATTPITGSLWPDAQLDAMRHQQDPPADVLIAALFAGGQVDAVNQLMKTLSTNDVLPPASLPSSVRDFLTATQGLPAAMNRYNRHASDGTAEAP